MAKKARDLKDIEVEELSMVNKAANKRKFLFFKQEGVPAKASTKKLKKKLNIIINSDGTIGGTKIVVNKDELKNLKDFNFSFWSDQGDLSHPVNCSYSKFVETDDGFSRSETFHLTKGDLPVDKEIQKQLQAYFGEDEKIDFEKSEETSVTAKALETINEYREDFPDDLKTAVGIVARQTGRPEQKVEKKDDSKDDKDTIAKAGAKLSKDTLKKITDALAALKSIIPELAEKTEKAESSDIEKMIATLSKSIETLEKNTQSDNKDENGKLVKTLSALADRLVVVEKSTGVKKSVEGQDDDNDSDTTLWPSISG